MPSEPIILSSESPRRAEILESLHIPFIKVIPAIDESVFDHLDPPERVTALAVAKARRGALRWKEARAHGSSDQGSRGRSEHSADPRFALGASEHGAPPRFALGADTLVAFKRENRWETIGKPVDALDAEAMLRREQGTRQYVFSGICLFDMELGTQEVALSVSEVLFAPMSDSEIAWYLSLGEWKGAAGAYRVQGAGSYFIEEIKGSFSGVMGLPIHELYGILQKFGYLASQQ